MNQDEYIKQLEKANEELVKKLEDAIDSHEKFCNNQFALRETLDKLNMRILREKRAKAIK